MNSDENGKPYEKYDDFRNESEFRGFVKAKLGTVCKIQDNHERRIRRTETAITKIYATASAIGAICGIIFSLVGDWFKDLLKK